MTRDQITTALDVLGLLLVAAGLAFWLWPRIGGSALAAAGGLVLVVSAAVEVLAGQRERRRGDRR